MIRFLLIGLVLSFGLVASCGPGGGDAVDTKKLEKEMPKSDPKTPDMPSPLEGYTPKAGTPPGAPKRG